MLQPPLECALKHRHTHVNSLKLSAMMRCVLNVWNIGGLWDERCTRKRVMKVISHSCWIGVWRVRVREKRWTWERKISSKSSHGNWKSYEEDMHISHNKTSQFKEKFHRLICAWKLLFIKLRNFYCLKFVCLVFNL